jgi:aspartyl protease family protein
MEMRGDQFFDEKGSGSNLVGWAVRQAIFWVVGGLAVYWVLGNRDLIGLHQQPQKPAETTAPTPAPTVRQVSGANSLILRAGRDGHVTVDAVVNGTPVRFLVDTGATLVTLTPKDAAAVGVGSGLSYSLTFETANGRTHAAPVRLREVRIGQLEIDDVDGAVVQNVSTSLLGQSFLSRLQGYEMRDGVLILNWQ